MRKALGVGIIALVVTSLSGLIGTSSAGGYQAQGQTEGQQGKARAQAVARQFLDRALLARGSDIIPQARLRDAVVGDVIYVHDPATLAARYGLVPIRSSAGKVVGVVAVDARTGARLWCNLECRGDSLLPVSEADARRILTKGLDALGRGNTTGGEAGGALGNAMLVEGCDKRFYWRFCSGAESWLVDTFDAEAPVLTSVDGSDARVMVPDVDGPADIEPVRGQPPQDGPEYEGPAEEAELAETLPPSFDLPGMPYHFQITDWFCGSAALQMVMDWYGEEVPQLDIACVGAGRLMTLAMGIARTDLRRAAHFSGMSTAYQDTSLHGYRERKLGYSAVDAYFSTNRALRLKRVLAAGYPVIALTWWSPGHEAWHYRVVKGYDDSLSVFVCHDPWYWPGWWGPNVLIDQATFCDDLWQYGGTWAMMAAPWEVTPTISPSGSVAVGDTVSVDVKVRYPGPGRFENLRPCSNCEATISLSGGLALAGGTATIALPDLASGDTAVVHWDVIAAGPAGKWGMALEARALVSDSSLSYPSYTDSIGGYAYEEVSIGSELVGDWGSEELLTPGPGVTETCFPASRAMVVGDDGTVHVVWSGMLEFGSDVYYRKRVGGMWSDETKISDSLATSSNACIAEGPDGRLHVAWTDLYWGVYEIYYKTWDPVRGWSADERVTYWTDLDYCPSIAVGDSAVYLVWQRNTGDPYRTGYVVAATRTAAGWSEPVDMDASPTRDSYRPSIACGPDGVVHVVYERQTADGPNERECIVHRSWDGTTWSEMTELSSAVSFSRTPSVAVGADSRVHVVWQDGENVDGDIFYRCLDGGIWQPVEQIVTLGTEASTPSVAAGAAGVVHVAWADNRHGASEIYVKSKDGAGWGSETRLSAAAGASLVPTVVAGAAGDVCVVWTDTRSGTAEVYFRERAAGAGVDGETDQSRRAGISLSAAYPQPFSDGMQVAFTLAEACDITVGVFDVEGRLVRLLASGTYGPGTHGATWEGTCTSGEHVAPGVYFVRCAGRLGEATRAVVLVR